MAQAAAGGDLDPEKDARHPGHPADPRCARSSTLSELMTQRKGNNLATFPRVGGPKIRIM